MAQEPYAAMRPRGAGSHTVRISPILILIFLSEVGRERRGPTPERERERGEPPTPERERNKGGKRERRGEREGRSRRAPSTTEQGGPGHATPNTHRTPAPRNLPAFEEEDEGCPCGAAGLACFFSQSSPSSRGPRAIKRSWGEGNDEQKEGASNGEEEARRETSSSLLAGQEMVILEVAQLYSISPNNSCKKR